MKEEKQFLLDETKKYINKFDSFFVMRYEGVSANLANSFRGEVLKRGGEVHILRKRLLMKAMEGMELSLDGIPMQGHLGLVFGGTDVSELVKSLLDFSKENGDAIQLVAAYVDQQLYGPSKVSFFAELPSKDEMRAQLLATLEAPLAQTLSVMESLLCSVPFCLQGKCDQEAPGQ